jgi:glycerol kinase
MARAAVEAIAYQVRDVFDVMRREAGRELGSLLADGGATRNDVLMQFQADVLGVPVLRNGSAEVSALGAAYLAGLASGVWSSVGEIEGLPRERERFEPNMEAQERESLYVGWQKAVAQATYGAGRAV